MSEQRFVTEQELAGAVNAFVIAISSLVDRMDKLNLLSSQGFSDDLRKAIPLVEEIAVRQKLGSPELTAGIIEMIVDALDGRPTKPWSPTLIDGGKLSET